MLSSSIHLLYHFQIIHFFCQINKGMVPLGSVCSEDDDVDENYVSMSAATTEPPVAPKLENRFIECYFIEL